MCHAYVDMHICQCKDCVGVVPDRDGEALHGNDWMLLARLAEEELRRLFNRFEEWQDVDLGLQEAFEREEKEKLLTDVGFEDLERGQAEDAAGE